MRSPLIEAACACQLSLDAAGRSGAENMAIDAALLDRANGTGLGLAVAQDLVTRNGGIIEFESEPGRTVFTLLLPLGEDT